MHAPVTKSRPAVAFRDVREDDLPMLFGLRRNLGVQSLLLTVPELLDDASLKSWIERRQMEPGGMFKIVEDVSRGEAIGYVQISQVHRRNRIGYEGLCLAETARGRGLGQATLGKLIATSRDELRLIKLFSEVRADNFVALRCHLLQGFKMVGTLRKHFADNAGVRHDVFFLERLLDGSST